MRKGRLSPNGVSSVGTGFHTIELLPKMSHGNHQATQVIVMTVGCSPKTDIKAPLLVPTQNLHPYVLVSMTWKALGRHLEEKTKHQPNHKTFYLQSVLPAKYTKAMVAQSLGE